MKLYLETGSGLTAGKDVKDFEFTGSADSSKVVKYCKEILESDDFKDLDDDPGDNHHPPGPGPLFSPTPRI